MDGSSAPLADYFWIAGVEDISYHDNEEVDTRPLSCLQLNDTIKEDFENEIPEIPESPTQAHSKDSTARHSRRSSFNRLSKLSTAEPRFSIQGFDENDGTRSNRSSATIRPVPPVNGGNGVDDGIPTPTDAAPITEPAPSTTGGGGQGTGFTGLPDFDFDKALMKFAAERENFLDDLSFTAGAKLQARPPMVNPRAERIKAEEGELSGRMSPLKSIKGSIRRKISFRDMNSVKRQTVTPRARPGKRHRTRCRQSLDYLLTASPSFCSDHEALEQLQFGHSASGTSQSGPRHAPSQEAF